MYTPGGGIAHVKSSKIGSTEWFKAYHGKQVHRVCSPNVRTSFTIKEALVNLLPIGEDESKASSDALIPWMVSLMIFLIDQ